MIPHLAAGGRVLQVVFAEFQPVQIVAGRRDARGEIFGWLLRTNSTNWVLLLIWIELSGFS